MADTDLTFKIQAVDEYKQQLESAISMVDKLSDAERNALQVSTDKVQADQKEAQAVMEKIGAIDKAADQTSQLSKAEQEAAQSTEQAGEAAQKNAQSTNEMGEASGKASVQIGGMQGALLTLNAAMGVAQTAIGTFKQVWDFAKEGAAIQRIGAQFNQVADDFGVNGDKLVAAMDKAAHGTVDDEELMQTATRALTQGVIKSSDDLVKFVEIARASSVRFGGDTTQALQSILYATEVGAQRSLKATIGVVDFTAAYDKLAVSLGKRKQDLTDEEQLQARVNAVLEKGQVLVDKVGNSNEDTATKMQRFETRSKDLEDRFHALAADAFGPVLDAGHDYEIMMDENASASDRLAAAQRILESGFSVNNSAMANKMIPSLTELAAKQNAATDSMDESERAARRDADAKAQDAEANRKLAVAQEGATTGAYGLSGALDESNRAAQRAAENKAYATSLTNNLDLALKYTQAEQRRSDIEAQIAKLDTEIAAKGSAHSVTVANQRMTEEQRAMTLQKLKVAQEDITQIQRKAGETEAEYGLRLSEAKKKVDDLSASLGVHTAVVGGATKAQLDQRDALQKQMDEFDRVQEVQRATDIFNAVSEAVKKGSISATEGAARLEALNNVSHLYSATALKTAQDQLALVAAFTDPNSKEWITLLHQGSSELDGITGKAADAAAAAQKIFEKPIHGKADIDVDTSAAEKKSAAFRDKIETGAAPKSKIDADTTKAEQHFADLTNKIETQPITAQVTIKETVQAQAGDSFAERAAQAREKSKAGSSDIAAQAVKDSKSIGDVAKTATDNLSSQASKSIQTVGHVGEESLGKLKTAQADTMTSIANSGEAANRELATADTWITKLEGTHIINFVVKVSGDPVPTGTGTSSPPIPERQHGGAVEREGLYQLHSNEFVLSEAMRYGRQPIPPQAIPFAARGGDTIINNNNFYDAMSTKLWQEKQRLDRVQSVAEAM